MLLRTAFPLKHHLRKGARPLLSHAIHRFHIEGKAPASRAFSSRLPRISTSEPSGWGGGVFRRSDGMSLPSRGQRPSPADSSCSSSPEATRALGFQTLADHSAKAWRRSTAISGCPHAAPRLVYPLSLRPRDRPQDPDGLFPIPARVYPSDGFSRTAIESTSFFSGWLSRGPLARGC